MSLHLSLLPADVSGRAGRDRLELLTALIAAPGFDPLYRSGLIRIPLDHPVYGVVYAHRVAEPGASLDQWAAAQAPEPGYGTCQVTACLFLAESPAGLCPGHQIRYRSAGKPPKRRPK